MTIYDIAREAGVSASMVSRVINNKPGVAAEKGRKYKSFWKKIIMCPMKWPEAL